jgi:hypothetical protein
MSMLRLSFKTSKGRIKFLNEAEDFFRGRGLRVTQRGYSYLLLEGGGGYVRIDVQENGDRQATLETREWENPVKEFAQNHHK